MFICRYIHTNISVCLYILVYYVLVYITLKMPIIPLLHYLLGTGGREV